MSFEIDVGRGSAMRRSRWRFSAMEGAGAHRAVRPIGRGQDQHTQHGRGAAQARSRTDRGFGTDAVRCDGIDLPPERAVPAMCFRTAGYSRTAVCARICFTVLPRPRSRSRSRSTKPSRSSASTICSTAGRGRFRAGRRSASRSAARFCSGPRFLLMDEPLASLDAARRDDIMTVIERVRDEFGLPTLYVSHDRAEVDRLATRVVAMPQTCCE
jgi:molybdate transport system ATP-binding protein